MNYVVPGTAAALGGIEVGDVLLSIGARGLSGSRAAMRAISVTASGTSTQVRLWRDRAIRTVTIRAQDPPAGQEPVNSNLVIPPPAARLDAPNLGMRLAELTDYTRGENKLRSDQTGVLVAGIVPFNVADDRRIKAGDVLVWPGRSRYRPGPMSRRIWTGCARRRRPSRPWMVQSSNRRRWVALPLAAGP